MAYTEVPTVNTSDSWSASDHNTYVKDNFIYFKNKTDLLVTNPARCMVSRITDWSTNTTLSNVTWETEVLDTDTMFTAGTPTRITITTAGLYLVTGKITWSSGTAGSYRHVGFYVNGDTALIVAALTVPAASAGVTQSSLSGLYIFSVADYIQMKTQSGETENATDANMAVIRLV